MYQIIDENENQKIDVNKITPEMLGLQATSDFAEYANQTIINEEPEKVKEWSKQGGIGVLEAGKMFAEEFDGTYDNVLTNQMQKDNYLLNHPKIEERSKKVEERIANNRKKIAERNKRVNEGTGSFLDRTGAFLDRLGNTNYEYQANSAELNKKSQNLHTGNANYRERIASVDRAGNAIYDEVDLTKKIGFLEGLRNSIENGSATPFVAGHIKKFTNNRLETIADKISNGEQITQGELEYFNNYKNRQYEKQIRGYSIAGNIGENWLPSMLAFGAEMALGGAVLKGLGLAGKGQLIGSAVTSGLTKINKAGKIGNALAKGIGFTTGETLEATLNSLVGGTLAGTAGGEFWASYSERRLNDKIKITDRGTVIFTEASETPAKAFLKSMQSVYISFFTESMGTLIGAGIVKPVGIGALQFRRVLEHCPKLKGFINKSSELLSKAYEKIYNGKGSEWLKSTVKFDGFLEELGEEVLEDVLNLSLGTNNEERNLENYIKTIFKTPEEWAVMSGMIALQGGSLSIAGNLLGDTMQRNGVPAEKIMEVLQNSTEAEKAELIDGLVENGSIKVEDFSKLFSGTLDAEAREVQEDYKNKLINQGVSKSRADFVSRIYTAMQTARADRTGVSLEDLYEEDNLKVIESEEERYQDMADYYENVAQEHGMNQFAQIAGAEEGEYADAQKEWEEKGTDSKYFKKWFGDSKVVDENGKPLVVYHGSLWNFDTFGKGAEFDFSFSPRFAHDYASTKSFEQGLDREPVLYDVYLKVENPFDFRDEKQVDEFIEKIKDRDIRIFGTPTSGEALKNDIMGFNYENTVKRQEDFDKAEIGMAYSRDNDNVEEHISSVARDKIVFKNKDYFVAAQELREPEYSYFSSREDRYQIRNKKEVYAELEKIAKDIDFKDTNKQKVIIQTEKVRAERAWDKDGKFYIKEDIQPYELEVTLLKIDNPKLAKKAGGYDNWFQLESMTIDGESFVEYIQNNGYDGYYKQEKGKLNISVFKPEQIKSTDNRGTFDADNPNIYYQGDNNIDEHNFPYNMQELLKQYGYGSDVYYKNKIEKIPDNDKKQIEKFKKDVDEVIKKISNNETLLGIDRINLGYTPKKLQQAGLKNIKLKIDAEVIKKAQNQKNEGHNLDIDTIKSIPELLHNPIVVMKSISKGHEEDSVVVITEAKDNEGYNVIVPIRLSVNENENKKGQKEYLINEIMSIHGRSNIDYVFSETLSRGGILKIDKNKMQDLHKFTTRLQNVAVASPTNVSINDNAENFKSSVKNNEEYHHDEPEQQSIFEGNNKARGFRKYKGAYMPAENIIEFFKGADESTIVHEFAHWYLNALVTDAKFHEGSKLDLDAVRKFVRNNGEPFTREQHEKFARGFEAYVRSGWAKNNRLKKVFEDFKNALLQIYDTITKIVYTEEGIEKPFTEEDMPHITALFDRLLSTENERIQATVFDKVNEIEEKINAIKANEQKEFDELDTIYKDNIEINNRKSDKKRAVGEYIEMAKTAASRESKELKAWKKRYKEVTYQILEVATGYPRQFIANKRNWDKVEQKIADIDDPFSGGDGFQGQWNEFYSDTGVSYETDEIGGDYKLAEQAFNVMSEGLYNKPLEDYLDFRDIEKFTGEFEYLENKIPKLKGTEKENAFEALTTLTLDLAPSMPDELYQDFLHRLVEIELEKKEEQKEDFNKKHYPNIPVMQQLQWYVTNKLNNLKIYNPEMRYKTRLDKSHGLYKQIRNASSVNDTKRIVKRINELVVEDMRNNQRAILHKEIQKQVKINSKLVKVGSIKRGKFDWRTNTVFAELVEMNKLSMDEAQTQFNELLRLNELEAGEERIDWRENSDEMSDTMKSDFQDNLKRKFLQYKSSRMKSLDVYHTSSLLSDILTLKAEGRRAKDAEDFIKKTERLDYRNNLIEILDKHKENKTAKFLANWVVGSGTLMNWETLLNTVFDNDTAKKYSLQNLESQVQVFSRNKTLELINKANEIYGFTNNTWDKLLDYDNSQKFIKLMQEYANETYDYSEITWNKETQEAVKTGLKLSRAEIMTIYTWYFNRELARRLDNQYGYKQLQDMFSKLSEKDKAMCFEFVNICESMYDAMNEVYIDTYGISLPKVENYFPSVTERVGSDLDMLHDFVVKSSNPSFIKQRKTCNRIPMKPKSPLEIILPHINKSANYIIMSETVNFYNKIFKETPLNKKIVDVFGKDKGEKIVRAIQNQLSASTFTTVARGITFAHEFADNLATNFISSSIAGSPKVMFSQLLSVINYAENMPAHLWAKGFTKALAHPKETFNYMMSKCPYLQARLAGNTQNEMMSTLTSEVDRFRTLKNFCSMNTKWGDILAIIFGGRPYVEYLMSEGMSEEEAFSKFVDDTLRAQQAGLNSTTSEWQKAQTKSVIGRAFFAFNNTNLQYERKFIDALSRLSKGDINTAQFAKSFIIYKILNPILFTSVLGNLSLLMLFRSLFGGDDPDKALSAFGGDVGLAIMLGSIKAYGMAGYIATQIINYGTALVQKKIFDEKPYVFESKVPILSSVDTIFKKAMKKEIEFSDYVDIMGDIGDLATGLPATRTFNALGGVGDVARGDIGIGATRMLGFGKYKATEAWTGQSPKERKKK